MKKLLILDLDETLIHSESFPGKDYLDKESYDFSFALGGGAWSTNKEYYYYTKKRPFLKEFMEYAFENFKVGIWTAADRDYASIILGEVGIPISKLDLFWTSDKCTIKMKNDDGTHPHDRQKYYGVKTLNKVRRSLDWNLKDILIVDDIYESAENNYGNLIHIKSFDNQVNDSELLKLITYLEKIKDEPDFRRIEKRGWSSDKG